jgi:N-methylhydantoinase A
LGYLPPTLLGGAMSLDVGAARPAVAAIGARLGLSMEHAAEGILKIANEVMLGALRVVTVQRGLDPRDFGIVAFGGAGPLHANAMAAVLGCYPVVVPRNPGVLSALGFIQSEFKNEFVQTFIRSTVNLDRQALAAQFSALIEKGEAWLAEEGIAAADQRLSASVDMRYEQQGFELTVDASASLTEGGDPAEAIAAFHELHERQYGVRFHVPVELIALRVTATGATPPMRTEREAESAGATVADAIIERRPCYFGGSWVDTPNYERSRLPRGARIEGPAIIVQYDTTTVLLPEHRAEVDDLGNILIWPNGKAGA